MAHPKKNECTPEEWQTELKRGRMYYALRKERLGPNPGITYAMEIRKRRQKRAKWVEWLSTKSCVHCGESNPIVLEMHHTLAKKDPRGSVSVILKRYGAEAAIAEAETNCMVLCANCHRIVTYNAQQH